MTSKNTILSQGAEATLTKVKIFGEWAVEKARTPKTYRHPELDARLRKERTAHEARMTHEVKTIGIPSPILYAWDSLNCKLIIEFINGTRLKNVLLQKGVSPSRKKNLCEEFGKIIAMMHVHGFVHGDLTTSNVLVRKKGKKDELVLIDFGLSAHSKKLEDIAVDLVNLKKTFTATHADFEEGWKIIQDAYRASGGKASALKQMEKVEQRIRYA